MITKIYVYDQEQNFYTILNPFPGAAEGEIINSVLLITLLWGI